MLSLHGFVSTPEDQQYRSQWDVVADAEDFLVVYPQGTGFPLRWNTQVTANVEVDDVQFVRDVIADLEQIAAVDPARVYVTGFSNGAHMTHHVACNLADSVAAVGIVSGMGPDLPGGCHPSRPVPLIAFFGTAEGDDFQARTETVSPFLVWLFDLSPEPVAIPSLDGWIEGWAKRNGCAPTPEAIPAAGDASGIHYTSCQGSADVILYTIDGGGHQWPGGSSYLFLGKTSTDINASRVMWEFFQAHPFPGGS